MKLYLSSYRVPTPEDFYELVGKRNNISAVAITNAKDYRGKEDTSKKLDLLVSDLGQLGVNTSFLDLRELNGSEEVLERVQGFDVIYGVGGNSFNLRQAMRQSGFDEAIGKILETQVVYCGESAGAVVIGPSLRGFERADSLDEVKGDIMWGGLGLIPQVVIPHADNPEYRDRVTPLLEDYPDAIVLNDNQAYVVNGNQRMVVSASE